MPAHLFWTYFCRMRTARRSYQSCGEEVRTLVVPLFLAAISRQILFKVMTPRQCAQIAMPKMLRAFPR
jgi:hypothetical protein